VTDPSHYQDVTCSFCGRHNREVHLVAKDSGLTICQVCVARCAEIIDADVGLEPFPWSERWPLKR
jgi:hypothetical protein